ncbi:hypothetical protein E4U55_005155 [Claviceps digitariae]|nr:hypothetical protein E4U55_005155 [Claviceps digitariae]
MTEYSTPGLPPAPPISQTTIPMAGLLVDIYGLDELPPAIPSPSCTATPNTPLTCLWLLHPRSRSRAFMRDIARRAVHAWHQTDQHLSRRRSLIALAFDMPNHGSRQICQTTNLSWDRGNLTHAIDMAGLIGTAAAEVSVLMGIVGGYLGRGPDVDAHVCLGWSLGGHAAWWSLFGEERMDGGVVMVGCADFVSLMSNRHKHCPLDTPKPFLGSYYFPPDLLTTVQSHDPKSILFGATSTPPSSVPSGEQARLRKILDARVRGKKVLVCSGGDDQLVPYALSAPLLALLKDAAKPGGWYEDGEFVLEDKVYSGLGHALSAEMVTDAVGFLVKLVAKGPRRANART